jgi:predicted transcriptional regulator
MGDSEAKMQNVTIHSRKPYRDRVAIVAEILEMACGGVQKTNLMYKVGLSSIMLSRYMRLMMNAKLVDIGLMDDKVVLRATDRGKEFLLHCQEIIDLLETENDSLRKPYRRIQAQAPFAS